LNKSTLSKIHLKPSEIETSLIDLKHHHEDHDDESSTSAAIEFFIYKHNIIDTLAVSKTKSRQLIENLQFNLSMLTNIAEEDIIGFDRSYYFHHAVLTDVTRMIVTHNRSEVPQNIADPHISFISIGMAMEPEATHKVTEDYLIEVAGHSRLVDINQVYSTKYQPR
jgi:hypothetical protein